MVSHCSAPSAYQAFMFGYHRALKIKQKDRLLPLLGHSLGHARTIGRLKNSYKETRNISALYALHGAYVGLTEVDSIISNKNEICAYFNAGGAQ